MPQRSPVIFWLLFTATICVDAVAVNWIFADRFDEESGTLYLALGYGQLSALSTWAILSHEFTRWRWVQPFVAGLAAGILAAASSSGSRSARIEEYLAFIGLFWLHVVLALSTLWAFKSTRRAWRFSIANLLLLMTVAAALLGLLGRNDLLIDEFASVISLIMGNIAVLGCAIAGRQCRLALLPALAVNCAAAILIGSLWEWGRLAFFENLNLIAFYLIQSLTLALWLIFIPTRHLERPGT